MALQGRYEILKTIGKTPAGAVHLCADLRLDGRRLAVKELIPGAPEEQEHLRRRFEEEAALLARLRHPKLPVIIDFFWEEGRLYLVREYIEGQTLAERIAASGPARERQALEWALEMAEVLEYLHSQEPPVIFRDLKPPNVVITEEGLKLIDFGLARTVVEPQGEPGFAAPEQQRSTLADLYALGATFYFCLMGRPPSPRQTLPPGLKPDTQSLLLRCLEPDPESRLSAASLVEDLRRRLGRTAETVIAPAAKPPDPVLKPLPPVRREKLPRWYRVTLAAASLVFALGVSAGGGWLLATQGPVPPTPTPVLPTFAGEEVAKLPPAEAQQRVKDWLQANPHDCWALLLESNLAAQASGKPLLHVPVMAPMSGKDRESGQWLVSGLLEAEREANVKPPYLVFEVHDDEGDQSVVLGIAEAICADPKVLVAVGPYSSQHTLLVAPVFDGGGCPLVSPVSADPRVADAGPFIFTVADSNRRRIEETARYLIAKGNRGVIVTADGNYLSRSMVQFFEEEALHEGAHLAPTLAYHQEKPDLSALAAQVRASQPQFVFIADNRGRVVAQVCQALREAGIECPLATQVVPGSPNLLSAGPAVEGLVMSTFFDPDSVGAAGQALLQRMHTLLGDGYINHAMVNSYDAGMVLAEVLRSCTTRVEVQKYLASFGSSRPVVKGISGPFTMRTPSELRKVLMVEVVHGRYQKVSP